MRPAFLTIIMITAGSTTAEQGPSPYSSKEAWLRAVPKRYQSRPEFAFVETDTGLPRVLLIGDSLSMSYTVGVRQRLADVANVYRAPDNCRSTRQTLAEIETYLGDGKWDVIHFNWGMHDITHLNAESKAAPPPEGSHQVPLEEYNRNVRRLVERLKKTGAQLLWAATTPVGQKTEAKGYRRDRDVVAYNAAAAEVMKANRVVTNDLYALTEPRAEQLLNDGVHFNTEGRRVSAMAVAAAIRKALGEKPGIRQSSLDLLARELLGASDEQLAQWAVGKRRGLFEIAPVNLPVDPPGDCNHFGWPIATMAGDTIVVMHRRIPGHCKEGSGRPHEKMSYGVVLRSDDGGETWSDPYDLRDCMQPEDRNRGGIVPLSHRFKFDEGNKSTEGYKIHLHAIGTSRDDAVVAVNNHGVFRSEDRGRTWKHFSKALRDDTFPHELVNIGPRILDHPKHGLLVFGNFFGTVEGPKKSDQLVVLSSLDNGATWQVEEHDTGFPQYEPAVLFHGDRFLFVTRDQTKARSHKQMSWSPGGKPVVIATNLRNPNNVDTADFSFNPMTERFELVRSERYRMQLWLWSIAPKDWPTGKWRRECRLLARGGNFYREADGFHPAGAIIDEKRGVQHIFIYSGHPNGPSGVFRITRTLDTAKLAEFFRPK
jgi:lysophospholipase L1-like esterase